MDLKDYLIQLNHSEDEFISQLSEVPLEMHHAAHESGWTILSIVEHIISSEKLFIKIIQREYEMENESTFMKGQAYLERALVTLRHRKVKAPEYLEPKNNIMDADAALNQFKSQREEFNSWLENHTNSNWKQLFPHPFFGNLTRADWLYVLLYHTKRHLLQINDRLNG